MSSCIYQSSKYYRQAFSNHFDVVEPLGYNFFNAGEVSRSVKKKRMGELTYKYINEKSNIKQISQRGTPNADLSKYLKICDPQRKNYYITSTSLSLVN